MSLSEAGQQRRLVLAGTAGNVMEWYDFAVYGYFVPLIAKHFFATDDPSDQMTPLIAAFGAFAAGFLMRPVGGLIFGHIGDKFGRKAALTLSVLAMAIPTFVIGLLPGKASIGIAAPILLVLCRMVQGLSVGGEYTTSIVFLVEKASASGRGRAGSWSSFGATAGVLLGSAVGALTTTLFADAPEALSAWGWRVPFLAGLVVGIAGLVVRQAIHEPPASPTASQRPPIVEALATEWRAILAVIALNLLTAVGFYLLFVYLVTWLQDVAGNPESVALDINTINMTVLLLVVPLAGWLSDRVGRKPVLLVGTLGILLGAWPLFWLMRHPDFGYGLFGQLGLAVLSGLYLGVIPVTMVEAFPARVRCSALSIGYNLSVGVLGGLTPMVATLLIQRTHNALSPAYLLMAAAGVSLVAVLSLRETSQLSLR